MMHAFLEFAGRRRARALAELLNIMMTANSGNAKSIKTLQRKLNDHAD